MKYCDFSEAKVGDRVWDFQYGWGFIEDIDEYIGVSFPISVWFYTEERKTFDFEGRLNRNAKPTLFWKEFEIPKEAFKKPEPNLEVDTLVWVWTNLKEEKYLRFFSHFNEYGEICTFSDGRDSSYTLHGLHNSASWKNWELYEKKDKKCILD